MKFSTLTRLAKKNKQAILLQDAYGEQWLDVGGAAYRLEGMPELNEDTVLTVMGITDNSKREKMLTGIRNAGEILKNDTTEKEIDIEDAGIAIIWSGKLLQPIYTSDGLLWLDMELMAPIAKKDAQYQRFYIREYGKARAVAIKEGLVLSALIFEMRTEGTELADAIIDLEDRSRAESVRRTGLRDEEEGEEE